MLLLTHGYAIKPEGTDSLVDLADETMTEFGIALTPGLWLVDTIPACTYVLHKANTHPHDFPQ